MNATVWINGHRLGTHAYGYTSFHFEVTPYLTFGKEHNVLAVRVDNSKRPNTRWYSGSGIYRHVWLTITDKIYMAPWGTAITTVKAPKSSATIQIETKVMNDTASAIDVQVETSIVGPDATLRSSPLRIDSQTGRSDAGQSNHHDKMTIM